MFEIIIVFGCLLGAMLLHDIVSSKERVSEEQEEIEEEILYMFEIIHQRLELLEDKKYGERKQEEGE
jgi:hypothetical protein